MTSSAPQSKQFNRSIYLAAEGMRLMRPRYFTPEVRQFPGLGEILSSRSPALDPIPFDHRGRV